MAQVINFLPTQASPPFSFQATLDGVQYTAIVRWGLYGQRWYLFLYALDGTRIFTVPMAASPDGYDISLTAGYFTTNLVYRESQQQFQIG